MRRETRRPWPLGWGSRRRHSGWTARPSTPWWPAARPTSISDCPRDADYREKIWDHAAGALIVARGRRHRDRHRRPTARVQPRARADGQPRGDRLQRAIAPAADRGDPGVGNRSGIARADRPWHVGPGHDRDGHDKLRVLALVERPRTAAAVPAHPVALSARARDCLSLRVWLAGRAGRRADRFGRDLAGRRVPRSGRPRRWDRGRQPGGGCRPSSGSMRRTPRSTRFAESGCCSSVCLIAGLLPGFVHAAPLVVLSVARRRGPGVSGLSVGRPASRNRPAGGASDPVGSVDSAGANDQPWWFAIWLVRWLAFRLMFLSGVVKLASHDPTWRDWTALEYHYQTQPLPTWTSWYIHQMPAGFHWLSAGFMFYAELVAPFFVFGPRPIRLAGFREPRALAVADRGDRQLRILQPAGDRHLSVHPG